MEEGDVKDTEYQESILDLWNQAIVKLRSFVETEVLPAVKASPEQCFKVKTLLDRSPILFLPLIRDFLDDDKYAKILDKNVDFFRMLFPPEFRTVEIPVEIQDRGVAFARVFRGLLFDLENE